LVVDRLGERESERETIKQRDILEMLHQHLIISAPGCHTILTELERFSSICFVFFWSRFFCFLAYVLQQYSPTRMWKRQLSLSTVAIQ
jgi:hypothetical protein